MNTSGSLVSRPCAPKHSLGAWSSPLFSAEVGSQATLGFMYKQKQRRGDTQCTLKSTGSLIFLQGQGLGLTKTPVSLMRWPGISERARVGRKSRLGLIWTVVLFVYLHKVVLYYI